MSDTRISTSAVIAAGIGMGTAGDLLLRAPGAAGLNFALLFAGLAASVVLVGWASDRRPSAEASSWLVLGVLFGAALMWRGAEVLRLAAFGAAAAAFALPAFRAGEGWVGRARVVDIVEALGSAGLHSGLGAVRLARRPSGTLARTLAGGLLLAALPLAVFGALFASADPVFAGIAHDLVSVDLRRFAGHGVVVGVLSWLASGYLAGYAGGTRLDALEPVRRARPSLRPGEVALALGLVDLMFLAFVAVQAGALFGGAAWVEGTEGLTYAAYAREGFFQLVAATALTLPWLLAAHALADNGPAPTRWTVRALAGTQIVLLLAIVASALVRMGAYIDAYGWTEDRIVATGVLVWLAAVVLWFGATVLRGRPRRFVVGALVGGYGLVAALLVVNPAARSAADQLDRRSPGGEVAAGAPDARYLASLGSDAVPILLDRFDHLDPEGACVVARRLLSRWGPDRPRDWRNWNRANRAAMDAVAAAQMALRAAAGRGDRCGE